MRVERAHALDRGGTDPLWAQLLADLRLRIGEGEFADGFPGELALTAQYAVSRHTVRTAVRVLRDEGTVTAGRGRVSRTAARDADAPGAVDSLFAAVEATGSQLRSVVSTIDLEHDAGAAARLRLEPSAPMMHLELLWLADDEPLAVDDVWLPESLGRPLLDEEALRAGDYAHVCGLGVTSGEERITAARPGAVLLRLLERPRGTAAFTIERVGWANGRPVEWRRTTVCTDRFAVTAQFSPRGYHLVLAADANRFRTNGSSRPDRP